MNRREREQLVDLGRAFSEALSDIANSNEESTTISAREEGPYENPSLDPEDIRGARAMVQPESTSAPYEIYIRQVNNGFIVNVGCQAFAFEKFETASKYMAMYFENPSETTRKHYEGTLFK